MGPRIYVGQETFLNAYTQYYNYAIGKEGNNFIAGLGSAIQASRSNAGPIDTVTALIQQGSALALTDTETQSEPTLSSSLELKTTQKHHGIMSSLKEGDTILLFDYDPDNHVEESERAKSYFPLESTWVIFAKRKGCKIWWIRPAWSKVELGEHVNVTDFEGVLSETELDKLPEIKGRVVVTFCMDFFENRRIPWLGANSGMFKREKKTTSQYEIKKRIIDIAKILNKKLKSKKIEPINVLHLAKSVAYAPQDQLEYVQEQLIKYFIETNTFESEKAILSGNNFLPLDENREVDFRQNALLCLIGQAI